MKKVLYEIVEDGNEREGDIFVRSDKTHFHLREVPAPNPWRKFEEGSMPKEGQKIILLCKNDEGGYWCFMTSFAEHGNWRDKSVVGYILFTPTAKD